jgi:hypothetical protein
MEKIGGLDELRQDQFAVVSGVRGVISVGAIVVLEADKAGILDAVALGWVTGNSTRSDSRECGENCTS